MADFLIARTTDGGTLWACIDPDALCSSPTIGERRFQAYLTPFYSHDAAHQALLEAGGVEVAPEGPRRRRGH